LITPSRLLWFDRASTALRLPPVIGICVVGLVPAACLWYLGIDIRIATDFTGVPLVSLPLLVVNVLFLLSASHLIRSRVQQLKDYTLSLGAGSQSDEIGELTYVKGIVVVWASLVLLTSLVLDPYFFNLYYSPFQACLRILVTSYLRFIQATFLWALGYSMYLIYKWGKLPIRLRSFAEDKTLGLNVYGRASLVFVTMYLVAMLITFPVFIYKSEAVMWSEVIFSLLGVAIFLGPLFSLRRKLLDAKNEKLGWIRRRHSRVIESIESCGDGPINAALVNELIAVDSIRNDLQRISGWPFNANVVAKLVTVVVIPLAFVLLSTYVLHLLNL
jgi:hypothetical protein